MRLRKVPLAEFTVDDIRFMIGQQTGLPWLLELALEILQENLFAEGDLLASVLQINPANWQANKKYWIAFDKLLRDRLEELTTFRPKLSIGNFYSAKFH